MLAANMGVDLALVAPSGPLNTVTKEDVQRYVKQSLSEPKAASSPKQEKKSAKPATTQAVEEGEDRIIDWSL